MQANESIIQDNSILLIIIIYMRSAFKVMTKKEFIEMKKKQKMEIELNNKFLTSLTKIQSVIRMVLSRRKVVAPLQLQVYQKLQILEVKKMEMENRKFSKLMAAAIYKMPYFFSVLIFVNQRNRQNHKDYVRLLVKILSNEDSACIKNIFDKKGFQLQQLEKLIKICICLCNQQKNELLQGFIIQYFILSSHQTYSELIQFSKFGRVLLAYLYKIINHYTNRQEVLRSLIRKLIYFQQISFSEIASILLKCNGLTQDYIQKVLNRLTGLTCNLNYEFCCKQQTATLFTKYSFILKILEKIPKREYLSVLLCIHNFIFERYELKIKKQILQSINDHNIKNNIELIVFQQIQNTSQYKMFVEDLPIDLYVKTVKQFQSYICEHIQVYLKEKLHNQLKELAGLYNMIVRFANISEFPELYCLQNLRNLYTIIERLDIKNKNFSEYAYSYAFDLLVWFIDTLTQHNAQMDDYIYTNSSMFLKKHQVENVVMILNRIILETITNKTLFSYGIGMEQSQSNITVQPYNPILKNVKYERLLNQASVLIKDYYNRNFRTKLIDIKYFQGFNLQHEITNLDFNQKNVNYLNKYLYFNKRLTKLYQCISKYKLGGSHQTIHINRGNQLHDAFYQITKNQIDMRKKLFIVFYNQLGCQEDGIDNGGLTKELINSVLSQAFDPANKLFFQTKNKQLLPMPHKQINGGMLVFIGKILAKAICEKIILQVKFSGVLLNILIGKRNTMEELRYLDLQIYKSLIRIKHGIDDVEKMELTFSTIETIDGQNEEIQLKSNGKNIAVRIDNKLEFIQLFSNFKVNLFFKESIAYFESGFNSIIQKSWLEHFNHDQIYRIISGDSNGFDVSDLVRNCEYEYYNEQELCIRWLWDILQQLTRQQKEQFLYFTTACSRPPTLGFHYLSPKFTIRKSGTNNHLPSAQTCINTLRLPAYKDKQTMKLKLIAAIQSNSGFYIT